ncbi:enoyl-CoA hydratase-related protein [Thermocrispum sp.]|jgi:enoyl-CoA hydratase/carnithine racemase|uniref:Enoyl-CoA hydratase-related protein n=1 Tax=Thermocrispum agreste TaxID=37925 RepID=A0ABD6FFP9_9PSEU|nr:enoyl-CoA hydratase-related protein [Thermocrispum sp.]
MVAGLEFSVDADSGIARLTFNRPDKHNAITLDMWRAIPELVAKVEADPTVLVLQLTGAGGSFSAGADVAEFRHLRAEPADAARYDEAVLGAVRALREMVKPSMAVLRGNCIGGGCQIAVACDLRFAAEGARFGITPAKLGIVYDFESTRQLVSLVGPARARYLLLSGELIDAARAREIGLVDDVVPAGELEQVADRFAATIASRSQASVRGMNRIIGKIAAGQHEPDDEVRHIRLRALTGEDYAEGVAAFLERRPPRFTFR